MSASLPVHQQFTTLQQLEITTLFHNGKSQSEIAAQFATQRRTIGKLLKYLGLYRSASDAGKLSIKSPWDDQVERVIELRKDHSLPEIVSILGIPLSSLHRLCQRHNITCQSDYAASQSSKMKAAWTDDKRRAASYRSLRNVTPELRKKLSESSKKLWRDGKYRIVQATHRAKQSWAVSSLQSILYSILDDLGVIYFREYTDRPNDPETVIGPYNFDCAIPRAGRPTLLIECHGDYWHSLGKAMVKDVQKQAYITNNFANVYELKCIWEHEFKCRDKVFELVKYWLGITSIEHVDFAFGEVSIALVNVKTSNTLLNKYHYLSGCGRGGIIYGAYYKDELIAVCAFSTLVRQNLPYDGQSTRELSRFCVHPKFQKPNFGSWMISRCIKLLPSHITTVVSYCDTTFNHDGALYKACNFALDGTVSPDYWYVNDAKWVMHKKTLYQHACKMSMTEREYATLHNYVRVYGTEKLRFIFKR